MLAVLIAQRIRCKSLLAALLVAGCAAAPPPDAVLPSPVLRQQTVALTPAQVAQLTALPSGGAYTVGPGDVLSVSVYLHPELSVPPPGASNAQGGVLVTQDGVVGLPLVGPVAISGLTLPQIDARLQAAYGAYLRDAHVSVQLVQAQSLRYYLLGDFVSPGIKYPARPLSLLEVLALGGSVDTAHADLYQAYVAKGGVKLPVDLHALLIGGDLTQNIVLAPGDTVVVPSAAAEDAFVFGAVAKPGAVNFQLGGLTLLQALSVAGMDLNNYEQARLRQIRIVREDGAVTRFFTVDGRRILRGAAAPFPLQPGDIVFVPPNDLAAWNAILNKLLPTLQTVAGVLDPFVAIKYLEQ